MKLSQEGYQLLEELEGKKRKLYRCKAGKPTIGIGCVVNPDKYYGITLTDKEIYELLDKRLVFFELAINNNVQGTLTQNQYDALVCFIFNIGVGAFLKSTLLKVLNKGTLQQVPFEMRKWKFITAPDGSKVIDQGLVNRREKEIKLFVRSDTTP